MANLEKISGNLDDVVTDQKKNLASTITNLSDVTGNLKSNSEKLGHIMDNFSSFSDSLTKMQMNSTINHLNGSVTNLQTILSKIDSTNGTLGLLVNDPRLYQNLNHTSESLNRLLVDFRLNPKKYIHFSAVDLGREVYVSPPSDNQIIDNVTFRVVIYKSLTPVSLTSPMFKGIEEVSEIKSGNNYYYVTPHESSYDKVVTILNKIQSAFPEAFLQTYKKGKEISLKNALKTNKK
jgi:phospholipid/cholesterol/gamma-HCH transport system substrate-binding protein